MDIMAVRVPDGDQISFPDCCVNCMGQASETKTKDVTFQLSASEMREGTTLFGGKKSFKLQRTVDVARKLVDIPYCDSCAAQDTAFRNQLETIKFASIGLAGILGAAGMAWMGSDMGTGTALFFGFIVFAILYQAFKGLFKLYPRWKIQGIKDFDNPNVGFRSHLQANLPDVHSQPQVSALLLSFRHEYAQKIADLNGLSIVKDPLEEKRDGQLQALKWVAIIVGVPLLIVLLIGIVGNLLT